MEDILMDLCSRFVLNTPEQASFDHMLFSVEQAHWFYDDFYREQDPTLASLSLRDFTELMFQHCPALRPYQNMIDDIYKSFTTYKTSVPVCGAIIMNREMDKCVLVKGWKGGASWGFPKGKRNKCEEDSDCAAREVREETGFDISPLLTSECLNVTMGQKRTCLFLVVGVDEKTAAFSPQTRKEISEVAWHRIDELPSDSNEKRGGNGFKYFMVWPFVRKLKSWIAKQRAQQYPPKRGNGAVAGSSKLSAPQATVAAAAGSSKGLGVKGGKKGEQVPEWFAPKVKGTCRQPDWLGIDTSLPIPVSAAGSKGASVGMGKIADGVGGDKDGVVHINGGLGAFGYESSVQRPTCWKTFSLDRERILEQLIVPNGVGGSWQGGAKRIGN
eukprot:jgi/Mesvir1/20848/Mv07939-RA.1